MKKIILTLMVIMALFVPSCSTTPVCITPSITPLEGKNISENLGRTEGRDWTFSVLGLFMIGSPDIELAVKDALSRNGGDTLINVSCYESSTWWLLFSIDRVIVKGDAVKFAPAEEKKGKRR